MSVSSTHRVQVGLFVFDVRVLFCGLPATLDEETVRHSHDVGLVNGRHSLPPVGLGVLESELGHPEKKNWAFLRFWSFVYNKLNLISFALKKPAVVTI